MSTSGAAVAPADCAMPTSASWACMRWMTSSFDVAGFQFTRVSTVCERWAKADGAIASAAPPATSNLRVSFASITLMHSCLLTRTFLPGRRRRDRSGRAGRLLLRLQLDQRVGHLVAAGRLLRPEQLQTAGHGPLREGVVGHIRISDL